MSEFNSSTFNSLTPGFIIYHNDIQVEFASSEKRLKEIIRKAFEKGVELRYEKV